ncbi:MBL fold metallo-hydrolase [Aceticella autotrophica]|uniref:MBL fold metallo-hydrolase n=1 Tax=Aceticella autotrophica TaxID=2755338 RepID=A0A975AVU8_9THEO|nr:MBL fold metallo-hydrolase [Aceticella autotrophica]QSZ27412.1 MBL fold metallo-hydrolase [Aceticella autotrophica]
MKFCSLRSGSGGNAVYIGYKDINLLIDAGLSGKIIEKSLVNINVDPNKLSAILITHEHNDHIKGAGVLSRRYDIPIYANPATWNVMERLLGNIDVKNKCNFKTGEEFSLGEIKIKSFKKSHDAAEPVGFSFFCNGKKITIATDLGYMSKGVASNIMGSDVVLLESNHDVDMLIKGKYPWALKKRILSDYGHLSNESAGEALKKLFELNSVGMVFLGHLSQENNKPEIAHKTVTDMIKKSGVKCHIHMALRNIESELIKI